MVSDDVFLKGVWSPYGETNTKPIKSYQPVVFTPLVSNQQNRPQKQSAYLKTNSAAGFEPSSPSQVSRAIKNQSSAILNSKHENNTAVTDVANSSAARNNSVVSPSATCSRLLWSPQSFAPNSRKSDVHQIKRETERISRNETKNSFMDDDRNFDTLSSILQQNDDTDSNLSEDWQTHSFNESHSNVIEAENNFKKNAGSNLINTSNSFSVAPNSWFKSLKCNSLKDSQLNTKYQYNCYPYIEISSSVRKEINGFKGNTQKLRPDKNGIDFGSNNGVTIKNVTDQMGHKDWYKQTCLSLHQQDQNESSTDISSLGKYGPTRVKHEAQKYRNQPWKIEDYVPGRHSSVVFNNQDDRSSRLRWFESDAEIDYWDDRETKIDDAGYMSSSYGADSVDRYHNRRKRQSVDQVDRRRPELEKILAEERQAKMFQEIRENEARRHHDTLMPKEKSCLLLNRFENLQPVQENIHPVQVNFDKSRIKGKARVLFTFRPQHQNELALKKGEIVTLLRKIDNNWYKGEINGQIGVFPLNYVDVIVSLDEARRIADDREGKAVAIYDFLGRSPLELSLKKGDEVMLIRHIDDNWCEGRLKGRQGIFPSSYVDILRQPLSPVSLSDNYSNTSRSSSALSVGPDLPSPWNSDYYESEFEKDSLDRDSFSTNSLTRTISKQERKEPTSIDTTFVYNHNQAASPNTFTASVDLEDFLKKSNNNKPQLNSTTTQKTNSQPQNLKTFQSPKNESKAKFTVIERCRALYGYKPQNEDELKLKEGDVISIVEKCDDGWFIGFCEWTGSFGTFPGNYVKIMS